MITKKVGIIGCGNMGEALLSRLSRVVEKSTALMVSETDAARRDYIQTKYKIIVEIDNNAVVKYSDVIILAVKPKDFDSVLKQEVCCGLSDKKLLISIAAGITTKYIENAVGKDIPVVRGCQCAEYFTVFLANAWPTSASRPSGEAGWGTLRPRHRTSSDRGRTLL